MYNHANLLFRMAIVFLIYLPSFIRKIFICSYLNSYLYAHCITHRSDLYISPSFFQNNLGKCYIGSCSLHVVHRACKGGFQSVEVAEKLVSNQ